MLCPVSCAICTQIGIVLDRHLRLLLDAVSSLHTTGWNSRDCAADRSHAPRLRLRPYKKERFDQRGIVQLLLAVSRFFSKHIPDTGCRGS